MSPTPGHKLGHAVLTHDWGVVVEYHREILGGWAAMSDALVRCAPADLPADPATIEKGLRRLANRGNKPGGQYGRWVLRHLGSPGGIEAWVRELGQYHSRLADLPTPAREQQLRAFDRPPITESKLSAWIDLGIASLLHRQREHKQSRERLDRALRGAARVGPVAQAEAWLFAGRVETDAGNRGQSNMLYQQVEAVLCEISGVDRLCYAARLAGQRAYHFTRPQAGESEDLDAAHELFDRLDEGGGIPFVGFRKYAGLALCAGQRGERQKACTLARRSADHAADGGLVRFRVMALLIVGRFADEAQSEESFDRAAKLALQLVDPDLQRRVKGARARRPSKTA